MDPQPQATEQHRLHEDVMPCCWARCSSVWRSGLPGDALSVPGEEAAGLVRVKVVQHVK